MAYIVDAEGRIQVSRNERAAVRVVYCTRCPTPHPFHSKCIDELPEKKKPSPSIVFWNDHKVEHCTCLYCWAIRTGR
jgi:hypothetical protein